MVKSLGNSSNRRNLSIKNIFISTWDTNWRNVGLNKKHPIFASTKVSTKASIKVLQLSIIHLSTKYICHCPLFNDSRIKHV